MGCAATQTNAATLDLSVGDRIHSILNANNLYLAQGSVEVPPHLIISLPQRYPPTNPALVLANHLLSPPLLESPRDLLLAVPPRASPALAPFSLSYHLLSPPLLESPLNLLPPRTSPVLAPFSLSYHLLSPPLLENPPNLLLTVPPQSQALTPLANLCHPESLHDLLPSVRLVDLLAPPLADPPSNPSSNPLQNPPLSLSFPSPL